MKNAEELTRKLLPHFPPRYHLLPPPPVEQKLLYDFLQLGGSVEDPIDVDMVGPASRGFKALHPALDPASRGQTDPSGGGRSYDYGVPNRRANRKRNQLYSMISCVSTLAPTIPRRNRAFKRTFVDFCGGCGHVGLVLAALYPGWDVIVVDFKQAPLDVVKSRAKAARLSNVRVWQGIVAEFPEEYKFDIGVALHACGQASDDVLAMCVARNACAVVAPCCVGAIVSTRQKYSEKAVNIFGKARSRKLRLQVDEAGFNVLARAADFGEAKHGGDFWRCGAKYLIENDRMKLLDELGYNSVLVKMKPLDCTPKNDVIVAYSKDREIVIGNKFKDDEYTNGEYAKIRNEGSIKNYPAEQVAEIEKRIRATVMAPGSPGMLEFKCARGSRERKIVHAVADKLGLKHESSGRGAQRAVCVWRGTHWPLFYEGYVGVAGKNVQKIAETLCLSIPQEAVATREKKRGKGFHLTLLKPGEISGTKLNPPKLLDLARNMLRNSHMSVLGVGACTNKDNDRKAFYAVVEWKEAQILRHMVGLPKGDLHITLGFINMDVYDKKKDAKTLVCKQKMLCNPWVV